MTHLRTGNYGPEYRYGVLVDHTDPAVGRLHVTASGRQVFVTPDGVSTPVLCGDLVMLHTEDGPVDGRCGGYVHGMDAACPGHQAQNDYWRNLSEAERYDVERREELYA